mgnify:CR=1 FL=1
MFEYDDGGRQAAGFKGGAGDCICRAVAIVSGRPYMDIYAALSRGAGRERKSKGATARNGIHSSCQWFKQQMKEWGFTWTPTMQIGSGCKVHLKAEELPLGRIITTVSRHWVAVIDGVIHDTHDPSRGGTRCVYGYWTLTPKGA